MNFEKVIFGFFITLAATLNFGFFIGEMDQPHLHHDFARVTGVPPGLFAARYAAGSSRGARPPVS